jgi:two-component system, OmpR family, sensor histidine kinase KdpD
LSPRRDPGVLAGAIAAIAVVVVAYTKWLHVSNALIVGFSFLLLVVIVAATARFWVAAAISLVAMLTFNFFFLPPVGTFTIADPQNWVALFVFLAVSLIASNLSTAARSRAQEAINRQHELGSLFDLSRDVLLTTDSAEAIRQLARFIARRFALDYVAVCLPRSGEWDVYDAGSLNIRLNPSELSMTLAAADRSLEFDARERTYGGQRTVEIDDQSVRLVPLRYGTKAVGLLAAAGRPIEPGTLDALAGVAAIAIERSQFLEERKTAELARRSEELKSALLASLAHDLRTPLTAIRIAAENLQASWLKETDRREQSDVIRGEVERLQRLFQNILDMARIDAGVAADRRWVHPSEIVAAAREQVDVALRRHPVDVEVESDVAVQLDPRLTAAALAHTLENAAQYSPAGSPIAVKVGVTADGLVISVRDRGPGIAATDLSHLFDRFYRGAASKGRIAGTGMGLSIARGMLAAEGGRIWVENCRDGGAQFTIAVPAQQKSAATLESAS